MKKPQLTFKGIVKEGKKLGRTLGYPTANIYFDHDINLAKGVYFCKILINQIAHWGMGIYWSNELNKLTFETYIFDFDQDIYNQEIEVNVLDFLRPSIKINSLEELKMLLINDEKTARKIIGDN